MFQFSVAPPPEPIAREPFHQWVFADGSPWTSFFRTKDGYLLRFSQLADFALDKNGHHVTAWPAEGVSEATLTHLYQNQVQPLAWSKQGKLVLHGSAVEIDGSAAAFIGRSGQGKSTLAASFATSGFRFLSDDGLVIDEMMGRCHVFANHPSIRLWQDSQAALIGVHAQAAPPVQYTSKARILAGTEVRFCNEPRPLHRVYFLGGPARGEDISFSPLKPAEALVELVKNSFMLDIDEREMLSANFEALARLAALPIYFRLDYPREYGALPAVRAAILSQIQEGQGIP